MTSPINPYEPPQAISVPVRAAFLERPIRLAGQISWSEAQHAFALAARSKPWIAGRNPPAPWVGRVVWGCIWVIGPVLIVNEPRQPMGYLLFAATSLMSVMMVRAYIQTRRLWREGKGTFTPFERSITQEGVTQKSEQGELTLGWNDFSRFKRSDHCVLLYFNPRTTYLIFPRAMFPGDLEWQDFLHFLQATLPEA